MPVSGASAVQRHVQSAFSSLGTRDRFGRGRATDIAETDKEDTWIMALPSAGSRLGKEV